MSSSSNNVGRRNRIAIYSAIGLSLFAADRIGLVQAAGADVWNLPKLEAQLQSDAQYRNVLQRRDDETLHRMAVKEALVADLLHGTRSLIEVTDEFYGMMAESPESLDLLCATYQCTDEREATARSVMSYVTLSERKPPPERLQIEFAQRFGRNWR
jgi:hypothetical protein